MLLDEIVKLGSEGASFSGNALSCEVRDQSFCCTSILALCEHYHDTLLSVLHR